MPGTDGRSEARLGLLWQAVDRFSQGSSMLESLPQEAPLTLRAGISHAVALAHLDRPVEALKILEVLDRAEWVSPEDRARVKLATASVWIQHRLLSRELLDHAAQALKEAEHVREALDFDDGVALKNLRAKWLIANRDPSAACRLLEALVREHHHEAAASMRNIWRPIVLAFAEAKHYWHDSTGKNRFQAFALTDALLLKQSLDLPERTQIFALGCKLCMSTGEVDQGINFFRAARQTLAGTDLEVEKQRLAALDTECGIGSFIRSRELRDELFDQLKRRARKRREV